LRELGHGRADPEEDRLAGLDERDRTPADQALLHRMCQGPPAEHQIEGPREVGRGATADRSQVTLGDELLDVPPNGHRRYVKLEGEACIVDRLLDRDPLQDAVVPIHGQQLTGHARESDACRSPRQGARMVVIR
jgi:hypothetical protein